MHPKLLYKLSGNHKCAVICSGAHPFWPLLMADVFQCLTSKQTNKQNTHTHKMLILLFRKNMFNFK